MSEAAPTDLEDGTRGVECLIYRSDGYLLARHEMTIHGAVTRSLDFNAAIEEVFEDMAAEVYTGIMEQPGL